MPRKAALRYSTTLLYVDMWFSKKQSRLRSDDVLFSIFLFSLFTLLTCVTWEHFSNYSLFCTMEVKYTVVDTESRPVICMLSNYGAKS